MAPPLRVASALLALALVAIPLASSNHSQTEMGRTVTFDHRTGNEWWVEVTMAGADAATIAKVEAMDTNGPWTSLAKRSATVYGSSFHIEPGHQVRFRATWSDGDVVTSCWFTHPAGVEQCAAQPALWQTAIVGDAGNPAAGGGDMAVGDADNDGRRDVTIGTWAGIYTFERDGAAWARQRVGAVQSIDALAAGDGDGDGAREIYVVSNGTLFQERFANGAWTHRALLRLPQNPTGGPTSSGDMTLGDIDGLPGPELYVAVGHTECPPDVPACFTDSYVYHIRLEAGIWRATSIYTSGGNLQSFWIGDGDSDGDAELYVGRTSRHAESKVQLEVVDGAWQATELPGWSGTGNQVVVGDVDRDGRREVYTASFTGDIGLISYDPATGNWTHRVLVTLSGGEPRALFIGDADNDGRQDLYVGKGDGEVVQVRHDAGQWRQAVVARVSDGARGPGDAAMLVVGDGDGDGRSEAYAGILFGWASGDLLTRVYRIGEPAATGFDAAFTGVRGNEWWQQVSVAAAGGTLSKVDVRLDGGAWQPMAKQSYGWTSSIRAVQGTIVQFKAASAAGATDLSDCYRWIPPANTDATKVACPGSTTTTTGGGAFDATFSGVKGNEWWVQASVSGNQPIQNVDARVDCSEEWRSLTRQSYGWAASFHVPAGSKVDFRATSTSGNSDISGGYVWPSATPASAC